MSIYWALYSVGRGLCVDVRGGTWQLEVLRGDVCACMTTHAFYMGSRNVNSDPHACTTEVLAHRAHSSSLMILKDVQDSECPAEHSLY